MGHLQRCIELFIADLEEGSLQLTEEMAGHLERDLSAIKRDVNGAVITGSCSDELRAAARGYWLVSKSTERENQVASAGEEALDPQTYTKDLYLHFKEIFREYTGREPTAFATEKSFPEAIHELGRDLSANPRRTTRMLERAQEKSAALRDFYKTAGPVLRAAQRLGGVKLVLGGKQAFSNASFEAVRSMALYADTVLVPDPVLPWFERERWEEQFKHVRMLESIWHLSKLEPLITADAIVPGLVIFPSFEKVLEDQDEFTQKGLEDEALAFFSFFFDGRFYDLSEVFEFARRHPETVIRTAIDKELFVAMGREPGEASDDPIAEQRAWLRQWRSKQFSEVVDETSDAELVCLSIAERLAPLYHLGENASEIGGGPLLSLPVQWHFAKLREKSLRGIDFNIQDESVVRALQLAPKSWLGRVPVSDLVRLRGEGANRSFRERVMSVMQGLETSAGVNSARIGREIEHEMKVMVQEHDRELEKIKKRFESRAAATATSAIITAAASFLPWLPTVSGVAAAGMATAFAANKAAESVALRSERKTLLGVLAASADVP